jgi:Prokaryotic E2 family E
VTTVALEELHPHADELAEQTGVHVHIEQEGAQVYVILHSLPLPARTYRVGNTDVLFITDTMYPLSAMDMFWTDPAVVRPDGAIAVVAGVGQGGQSGGGGTVEGGQGVGAGGGDVVHGAGLGMGDPQREPVRGEDGLDVAAVTVRLAGGESGVFGPFQRFAQVRGLAGEDLDDLVQVPVGGGPRDAVIAGQGVRAGAVAEPAQHQHGLPEAGQRPAPRGCAAAAPLSGQQIRGELHQFPGDVERGTIGDHVEPSGEEDLVVRPLVVGLHVHVQPARFLRVSARISLYAEDKARLPEPISLRSPQ